MTAAADFQAAESRLAAPDAAAFARLSARQQQILRAMAALHAGDRTGVLAAASAAREAGQHDIGWLLELLVAAKDELPRTTKARELPGAAEVPDLLLAVKSWRSGGKPRGSEHLRRLAPARPALRALLETLGGRRRIAPDGLAAVSPRVEAILLAAQVAIHRPNSDLQTLVRQALPGNTLDLSSYHHGDSPLARLPALQRWLADPRSEWTHDHTLMAATLGVRQPKRIPAVLGVLLPALHRRLVAGQGHSLLAPTSAFAALARAAGLTVLAGQLDVLERRLGALLEPAHHLGPLLTLWRRCVGRPTGERLALATRIADVVSVLLVEDVGPPAELPFVAEVLVYLMTHTEDPAKRTRLLTAFGWMLPDNAIHDVLARAPDDIRIYQIAFRSLARGQIEPALAALPTLARIPGAGATTSKLIAQVFDALEDEDASPRILRHLERTLTELTQIDWQADRPLLPALLGAADDLEAGVAPARTLVRRELARPLPDGDPGIVADILARHHLDEDGEAKELVRRIGRWTRRVDPDTADDLVLRVLAGVYGYLDDARDPEALPQIVASLTDFILRDGPGRPRRAAQRANAPSSGLAHGYAAWARAQYDRLGDDPYWSALSAVLEEDDSPDFDDDDDDNLDIPF